jgi:integrase
MRRGEMLNMRWRDVSLERRTLHIPFTKNGHERTIRSEDGMEAINEACSVGEPAVS